MITHAIIIQLFIKLGKGLELLTNEGTQIRDTEQILEHALA